MLVQRLAQPRLACLDRWESFFRGCCAQPLMVSSQQVKRWGRRSAAIESPESVLENTRHLLEVRITLLTSCRDGIVDIRPGLWICRLGC